MDDAPELMTTLQALLDQEQALCVSAAVRLGNIVQITEYGLALLNTAVASVVTGNEVIAGIQLAIQKSAALAYLSYCRSHSAQAEFNCRQVIEYTCLGAYFLAHPDADTYRTDKDGNVTLIPNQKINDRVISWISKALPQQSAALKEIKTELNASVLHGSLYGTSLTMSYDQEAPNRYLGSFFDNVGPDCYRAWLLRLCDIMALSLDTIRQANDAAGAIIYRQETDDRFAGFVNSIDRYRRGYQEYLRAEGAKL